MDGFIRFVRNLSIVCGFAGAALIAAGVVVVCQMVFVRFVLGSTTVWQTDFTTYSLVAATFIASPYVLLTRGHVNVDLLPQHFTGAARFRLALFSILMSMAFTTIMNRMVCSLPGGRSRAVFGGFCGNDERGGPESTSAGRAGP